MDAPPPGDRDAAVGEQAGVGSGRRTARPGRGRRVDGARDRPVVAGDVPRAHARRGPGRSGGFVATRVQFLERLRLTRRALPGTTGSLSPSEAGGSSGWPCPGPAQDADATLADPAPRAVRLRGRPRLRRGRSTPALGRSPGRGRRPGHPVLHPIIDFDIAARGERYSHPPARHITRSIPSPGDRGRPGGRAGGASSPRSAHGHAGDLAREPVDRSARDRNRVDRQQTGAEQVRCSDPISSTVRTPHSAIVRSSSAHTCSMTARAPSAPASASPYTQGRPTEHRAGRPARAPHDVRPATDAAVDQHGHPPVDLLDDTRQRVERRDAPSTCRPPWFDTTMPSTPWSSASAASGGCWMPLRTIGRDVRSRSRARSAQVSVDREKTSRNVSTAARGSGDRRLVRRSPG